MHWFATLQKRYSYCISNQDAKIRNYYHIRRKEYEKEFSYDDCGRIDPIVMRNIHQSDIISGRAGIPGRHLRQHPGLPDKRGEEGRQGRNRCSHSTDQGIADIPFRRQERHHNDSRQLRCNHKIRQEHRQHDSHCRRKPL